MDGSTKIEYSAEIDIRIDWSDMDSLGHVNNLAIMRYMQTAKVLFFEKLGMPPADETLDVRPIMASVSGQFRKQIFYPGKVRVLSRVTELKTTSIHMKHYVIDDADEVAAEGLDVLVMFDFKKNAKHPIPEELRKKIEAVEAERRVFTDDRGRSS